MRAFVISPTGPKPPSGENEAQPASSRAAAAATRCLACGCMDRKVVTAGRRPESRKAIAVSPASMIGEGVWTKKFCSGWRPYSTRWFPIQLGRRGVTAIGVESAPPLYRTALYAVRRSRAENVGILALRATPQTAQALPAADCVLLLAVWHHFVRDYGLDGATEILRMIWSKTAQVLFFDTGESEMPPEFGLPDLVPDPRRWLEGYLERTCEDGRVRHLGLHDALAPDGKPVKRNLLAVVRGGALTAA